MTGSDKAHTAVTPSGLTQGSSKTHGGGEVTNRCRVTQCVNLRHLQQRGNAAMLGHVTQPLLWLQSGMLPCLLRVSWGTGIFPDACAGWGLPLGRTVLHTLPQSCLLSVHAQCSSERTCSLLKTALLAGPTTCEGWGGAMGEHPHRDKAESLFLGGSSKQQRVKPPRMCKLVFQCLQVAMDNQRFLNSRAPTLRTLQ